MDSIKSPRFLLALAGLIAVSVLAAFKVFSAEMAYGLLGGLLYGVGVSTPPSKQAIANAASLLGVAGAGVGTAVLLGGCVGPDAVMASFIAAACVVACGGAVYVLRYRKAAKRARYERIRRRLSGRTLLELKHAVSATCIVALLAAPGCATTGGGKDDVDLCRVADLAVASHQVAASTAQLICQSVKDPAKRAECLKQERKYQTIGELLLTLGYSALSACQVK